MLAVTEENILVHVDVDNKEEVIRLLTDLLVKNGYVKPEYYNVLMEREERYPTGLPTEGVQVAIPHGFSPDSVIKPAVGIAVLKRPVIFRNMAAQEEELSVELVFLLALKGEHEATADLERVMSVFSNGGLLKRLRAAESGRLVVKLMGESLSES